MIEQSLFDFFKKHGISYQLFEHQPVFTVSDRAIVTAVDGVTASSACLPKPGFKTLFLKDNKNHYFFVSLIEDKRVDLNGLSKTLGCGRFSFGTPEELLNMTKLTPGSVTPYGLLFDQTNAITLILDEEALQLAFVQFHPMKNDMTVVTTPDVFLQCMELMHHKPIIIRIPFKK